MTQTSSYVAAMSLAIVLCVLKRPLIAVLVVAVISAQHPLSQTLKGELLLFGSILGLCAIILVLSVLS